MPRRSPVHHRDHLKKHGQDGSNYEHETQKTVTPGPDSQLDQRDGDRAFAGNQPMKVDSETQIEPDRFKALN